MKLLIHSYSELSSNYFEGPVYELSELHSEPDLSRIAGLSLPKRRSVGDSPLAAA